MGGSAPRVGPQNFTAFFRDEIFLWPPTWPSFVYTQHLLALPSSNPSRPTQIWAAAGGPGLRSCQTVTKASSIDANPEVQLPATFVKIETPEHRQVMKPL